MKRKMSMKELFLSKNKKSINVLYSKPRESSLHLLTLRRKLSSLITSLMIPVHRDISDTCEWDDGNMKLYGSV